MHQPIMLMFNDCYDFVFNLQLSPLFFSIAQNPSSYCHLESQVMYSYIWIFIIMDYW